MSLLLPKAFSCLFHADVLPYFSIPCSLEYVAGIHLPKMKNEIIRPPEAGLTILFLDNINQYVD